MTDNPTARQLAALRHQRAALDVQIHAMEAHEEEVRQQSSAESKDRDEHSDGKSRRESGDI